MAVMNPCCCCRLQLGVTIVAVINIISSVLMLIWSILQLLFLFGIAILYVAADDSKTKTNDANDHRTVSTETRNATLAAVGIVLLIFSIVFIIEALVSLIASIFLFIGARKRNIYKCRIWLVLALLFLLFYFMSVCSRLVFGSGKSYSINSEHEDLELGVTATIFQFLIVFAIVGYQVWVVYAFMEEVKAERSGLNAPDGPAVHYVPKDNVVENPPPYGHGGYAPYLPAAAPSYPPQGGFYPGIPSDDNQQLPYKTTTSNY